METTHIAQTAIAGTDDWTDISKPTNEDQAHDMIRPYRRNRHFDARVITVQP